MTDRRISEAREPSVTRAWGSGDTWRKNDFLVIIFATIMKFQDQLDRFSHGRSQKRPKEGVLKMQKRFGYLRDSHFVRILVKITKKLAQCMGMGF